MRNWRNAEVKAKSVDKGLPDFKIVKGENEKSCQDWSVQESSGDN